MLHDSRLKERSHSDMAEDADEEDENDPEADLVVNRKSVVVKHDPKVVDSNSGAEILPWDIASIEESQLLTIHRLNDWDFPIFELADSCKNNILSKVRMSLSVYIVSPSELKYFICFVTKLVMWYFKSIFLHTENDVTLV